MMTDDIFRTADPRAAVQALREELFDAGFRPVGVSNTDTNHTSAGKAPMDADWVEGARQDPPRAVAHVRDDALNTGILCDGLRVLDIDVEDADIVHRIRAMAFTAWGETVMRYRNNSPRCLMPYRAAIGAPSKRAIAGRFGKVEILGHGQQFVAYGRHPSGANLLWTPEAPHATALESLPAITEEQVTAFLAAVAPILQSPGERAGAAARPEDREELRTLLEGLERCGAAGFGAFAELAQDVQDRIRAAIRSNPRAKDRWGGMCDDLDASGKDSSRSGMDMSLAALLKRGGCSPLDAALALLVFPHGGAHDTEKHPSPATRLRYVARTALRAGQDFGLFRRRDTPQPPGGGSKPPGAGGDDFDWEARPDSEEEAPLAGITEDDVAMAFATEQAGAVSFNHSRNGWMIWRDNRWSADERSRVFTMCRDFTRSARFGAEKGGAALGKIGFASAVERACRADARLATVETDWDADPNLLGTPDGVIDLTTGAMRAARPEDRISRSTLVAAAPPGTAFPLWQSFMDDATGEDEELQNFLQRFAGYCLTGDVTEEVLGFLYGGGGNGKGVFIGTITAIMHDYALSMPIEAFTTGGKSNPEYYRAQMAGARLVTASETEAGATWAEAQIKELTGNEAPVSARHIYGKPFTYRPLFKLWIVGNFAPQLRTRSAAMERRMRIIPFDRVPTRPDQDLKAKLVAEYPAILRWMLDGCASWREARLGTAKAVAAASAAYFEEQDAFGRWLSEACVLLAEASIKSGVAYASYKEWCLGNGEVPLSVRSWAETIDRHPKLKRSLSAGTMMVRGLGFRADNSRQGGDR